MSKKSDYKLRYCSAVYFKGGGYTTIFGIDEGACKHAVEYMTSGSRFRLFFGASVPYEVVPGEYVDGKLIKGDYKLPEDFLRDMNLETRMVVIGELEVDE